MAQVILITSGKGGTGKSTVCAGLGISLARLGHQVLLAEGGRRSLDVQFGLDEDFTSTSLRTVVEKYIRLGLITATDDVDAVMEKVWTPVLDE